MNSAGKCERPMLCGGGIGPPWLLGFDTPQNGPCRVGVTPVLLPLAQRHRTAQFSVRNGSAQHQEAELARDLPAQRLAKLIAIRAGLPWPCFYILREDGLARNMFPLPQPCARFPPRGQAPARNAPRSAPMQPQSKRVP